MGSHSGDAIGLGTRLASEVSRRSIPEGLAARIEAARGTISAAYEGLVDEVDRLDPSLRRTVELQAAYSARRLDIVEKKTARALLRRDAEVGRQAAALAAALVPRGHLQERTLCPIAFAAHGGMDVAARIARGHGHLAARSPGDHGMKIDLLAFGPHPDDAEIGAGAP